MVDMVEQPPALDKGVALGLAGVFLFLGSHHDDTDVSVTGCQSAFLGQYDPKHTLSRYFGRGENIKLVGHPIEESITRRHLDELTIESHVLTTMLGW